MEEDKNMRRDLEGEADVSGEQLLGEYYSQDVDDKHYMGYGVYGQTAGSDCCC